MDVWRKAQFVDLFEIAFIGREVAPALLQGFQNLADVAETLVIVVVIGIGIAILKGRGQFLVKFSLFR